MNKARILMMLSAVLIVVAVPMWAVCQDDQIPEGSTKEFMRLKLKYAQQLLEGLSLRDFRQIENSAQQLGLLSLESRWNVIQSVRYNEMSSDFRETADLMKDAAKQQNLDLAILGYLEMTLKCVQCHKYLRDTEGRGPGLSSRRQGDQ